MKKTVKTLEEFLSLQYEVKITPFEEDDEMGYVITCPEIEGIEVYGENIEEALEELKEAKIAIFELNKELNIPINYPKNYHESKTELSGRLTARLPVYLHRKIKNFAKENSISVNTAIIQLISEGFKNSELEAIQREMKEIKKMMGKNPEVNYLFVEQEKIMEIPAFGNKPKKKDGFIPYDYNTDM